MHRLYVDKPLWTKVSFERHSKYTTHLQRTLQAAYKTTYVSTVAYYKTIDHEPWLNGL